MTQSRTSYVAAVLAAACTFSALALRAGYPRLGYWFTFFVLSVVACVFLGALVLLVLVVRMSDGGFIPIATGIVAFALIASCAVVVGRRLVGLMFYAPSGQDVDGAFVVQKWLQPDYGDGAREIRALYFRGRKVAPRLVSYVHNPAQPAVVIFVQNESNGLVATYAFDGGTFRTLRLTSGSTLPFPDYWSPDKTKLILHWIDGFYVFDTVRWRVSHPTGQVVPPAPAYALKFDWSPGSRRFAQIESGFPISQPLVLREWDAETLISRIVGCVPNSRGWSDTDFSWQDDSLVVAEEARRYYTLCPDGTR